MAYSSSEVHYLHLYEQLKQTEVKSVLQYFDDNWHDIRQQWVNGLKNNQINLSLHVKLQSQDDIFFVESSEGRINVTLDECQCSFWKTMKLPCWHIFACRAQCKESLYSPFLCALRWTQQFYKSSHLVNTETEVSVNQNSEFISTCSSLSAKKILSQNEKYRTAYNISQKLASLLSESSMREYQQKLSILMKDIVSIWETGGRCTMQECNEDGEFDDDELDKSEVPDQRMPIPPLPVVEVAENCKYVYYEQ
uniref:SWIM-type domain-containing protein n=1 Tax=Amphimedon queenslandica TaxID=400682 RepID=A0A1X7VCY6_AMPQE